MYVFQLDTSTRICWLLLFTLGRVCVAHFRQKGGVFLWKTPFSSVWCGSFSRNCFFTTSTFSFLSLEMDFLWGVMGSPFPHKVDPLLLFTPFPHSSSINDLYLSHKCLHLQSSYLSGIYISLGLHLHFHLSHLRTLCFFISISHASKPYIWMLKKKAPERAKLLCYILKRTLSISISLTQKPSQSSLIDTKMCNI